MINDFDRFFLNLPPTDREKDFNNFWDQALLELKKIPIDPVIEKNNIIESGKFDIYDTTFTGYGKYKVKGELYIPKEFNPKGFNPKGFKEKKPKIILHIHDYNFPAKPGEDALDSELAYFFLRLRGHDLIINSSPDREEIKSPGYMIENILEKNNYYVKKIYLDAVRSIDFLRLYNKVDCKGIGIIGKGLGAAAAVLAAGISNRIASLVLDSPSFCYLELNQNISKSDASNEINLFLTDNQSKRDIIKKNLSYFDAINHSHRIKIPVMAVIGLRDIISPPECAFALFNHLKCEKTVEVYPEDNHTAGGDFQLKKSIKWIKEILMKENNSEKSN